VSGFTSLGCVSFPGYGPGAGWNCSDLGTLNGSLTMEFQEGTGDGYGAWANLGGDAGGNFGGSVDNYTNGDCSGSVTNYSNTGSEYSFTCFENDDGSFGVTFILSTAYGPGEVYDFAVGSGTITLTGAMIEANGFTIPLSGGNLVSSGSVTVSW
jgi:hypothetical protein